MGTPDEWLYEYAMIRYVPRINREEFLNIGLVMMNKRRQWMKGMILLDEKRILSFYPCADMESLYCQSRLFEKTDVPGPNLPIEEKYRWMTAVKSAAIQVSPSHPGIVNFENLTEMCQKKSADKIMEEEFNRLFEELVG